MSKFVKITSVSTTTPEDMFTLGVTTSRGKDDKIGQFGSGSLMGTLVWMRNFGKSPVFLINGKKITFETKSILKSDGHPFQQVLLCNGRKKTPLSVALEYGELDWKFPELGLREWISNAIDAGQDPKTMITLVDKVEASDDEVAIFLPYTGVAREYFDNLEKYFLHFSGKQDEKILIKEKVSPCRVYRKGVFIRELAEESLFDYNLLFSINECRTGSSDSIKSDIQYEFAYGYADIEKHRILRDAILIGRKTVEISENTWDRISEVCKEVWSELIGKIGLCPDTHIIANCTAIDSAWYKKIVENVPLLDGLTEMTEAEIRGMVVSLPSATIAKHYDKICEVIETIGLGMGKGRPSLHMFDTKDNSEPMFQGLYTKSRGRQEIMVFSRSKELTKVMVHELSHHYSGGDDYSFCFSDFGHKVIAEIIDQLM